MSLFQGRSRVVTGASSPMITSPQSLFQCLCDGTEAEPLEVISHPCVRVPFQSVQ